MSKLIGCLTAILMLVTLTACGGTDDTAPVTTTTEAARSTTITGGETTVTTTTTAETTDGTTTTTTSPTPATTSAADVTDGTTVTTTRHSTTTTHCTTTTRTATTTAPVTTTRRTTTTARPTTTATTAKPTTTTAKPTTATTAAPSATEYEQEVLRLVNAERAAQGLSPLSYYSAGQQAADIRAGEIRTAFSHTRPNGESCFTVLKEAGISYRSAGENIAYGYSTPAAVMDGWMNSDGHRANILGANFTHLIVGHDNGYWVQLFLTL